MRPDFWYAVYVCGCCALVLARKLTRGDPEHLVAAFAEAVGWPMVILFLVVDILVPDD